KVRARVTNRLLWNALDVLHEQVHGQKSRRVADVLQTDRQLTTVLGHEDFLLNSGASAPACETPLPVKDQRSGAGGRGAGKTNVPRNFLDSGQTTTQEIRREVPLLIHHPDSPE